MTFERGGVTEYVFRALSGLALSSLYGLAIGARQGGRALLVHALGVPLGLLLVAVIGAPSLFVFLSLCKVPIDGRRLWGLAVRGLGNAGLLLAGLAPAAALFVVSSETPHAASGAVLVGLLLGGGVALGRTTWEILRESVPGTMSSLLAAIGVPIGFAVFAALLAVRVWSAVLPILGGAS
jgi:hypothetical protein